MPSGKQASRAATAMTMPNFTYGCAPTAFMEAPSSVLETVANV